MPRSSCSLCHRTWTEENVALFHVPQNHTARQKWSESCGVKFTTSSKVCALHFSPQDFNTEPDEKRRRLAKDAVPMVVEYLTSWDELNETRTQDISTQTDPFTESALQRENLRLRKTIKLLQTENAQLRAQVGELDSVRKSVSAIFTEGQIKKLKRPSAKMHWTHEDISWAITLHSAGPRAYNHLYRKGFPLPCESTISKWSQNLQFGEGILHFIIHAMEDTEDAPLIDRLCVLAFDEMKVASVYEHDPLTDSIKKPSNYVQVVIARGIKKSWKQPIFYDFDCKMTKAILDTLIVALSKAGYPVVAIVSDMGGSNQALWKELEVSTEKTWFRNPSNMDDKVFVFADAPHLLKLFRNHFLDTGLVVDGKIITIQTIKEVMNYSSTSDVSITYKLTEEHLTTHHSGRQKVKLAAQLFSHSTACAIRHCYATGMPLHNPCETAQLIEQVNNWFDVFNSKLASTRNPIQKPFGQDLGVQLEVLADITNLLQKPIVPNRKALLPFQKGILMSIKSLTELHAHLHGKYGLEYIATYRLNQDIVEHFFGAMRSKGGLYDNPSPMHFKYRLRKYLLARNTEILSTAGNVQADDTEWLQLKEVIGNTVSEFLSEKDKAVVDVPLELFEDWDYGEAEKLDSLHEDALEYVAGFIIRKLKRFEYESTEPTYTWVTALSRGGLTKPSSEFVNKIKALERDFLKLNGDNILSGKCFTNKLMEASAANDLPEEIKKLFFKCRMHFRIKSLNKMLKERSRGRRNTIPTM